MLTHSTFPAEIDWKQLVHNRLQLFGHRNWIVIADSAYPAQSRPAVETVVVDAGQLTVLEEVLHQISASRHIAASVKLDTELDHLSDAQVKGIEDYRRSLALLLGERKPAAMPHEQIIAKLDEVGQLYRVLILKTNSTLPYSTVFMQLDCGYWTPEQEHKLRQAMQHH